MGSCSKCLNKVYSRVSLGMFRAITLLATSCCNLEPYMVEVTCKSWWSPHVPWLFWTLELSSLSIRKVTNVFNFVLTFMYVNRTQSLDQFSLGRPSKPKSTTKERQNEDEEKDNSQGGSCSIPPGYQYHRSHPRIKMHNQRQNTGSCITHNSGKSE